MEEYSNYVDYDLVDDLGTPITKETFEKQNWIYCKDMYDGDEVEYWILPLPIDNPDENSPYLVSSLETDSEVLELEPGEFVIEMFGMNGLGLCKTEEQIKILYYSLTSTDLDEVLSEIQNNN